MANESWESDPQFQRVLVQEFRRAMSRPFEATDWRHELFGEKPMRTKACTIHGTQTGGKPFACEECEFIVRMFKDGESIATLIGRTGYRNDQIEERLREWMRQFGNA